MKEIIFDEDEISMIMLGVGAFEELDKNGTKKKAPDLIHLMASSIINGIAATLKFFDTENPDEVELMRGLLAFIAGNPVVEKIFNLVSENLDEKIGFRVSKMVDDFIKDAQETMFHVVEGSENGCKPS